jgi:hypothetical protein
MGDEKKKNNKTWRHFFREKLLKNKEKEKYKQVLRQLPPPEKKDSGN